MKRNQHGINLDEGIALVDEEEFKLLYIESACACERDLSTWISEGKRAVLFGGQIGFGKTTAIKQAFRLSETTPDIEFHFGRNDLNLSPLDFRDSAVFFRRVFLYFGGWFSRLC